MGRRWLKKMTEKKRKKEMIKKSLKSRKKRDYESMPRRGGFSEQRK